MSDYHLGPLYLYLEDESIYMESGYLSRVNVGPCSDDAARPATLNYSAAQSGYINSKETPLQGNVSISTDELLDEFPFDGEALEHESESLSVGCAVKVDSVQDQCGNTHTGGGFCLIHNMVKKKKVMALVPPSLFSGKLRMLIQSVYGSKRTDINAVDFGDSIIPGMLELAGFQISCFYSPSFGLFTTTDYQYFLIKVTNVVEYYPILITEKAQTFVDILVDHPRNNEPAFVKKVEAYILSTAKVDTANVIVGGSMPTLAGDPLSYGWHWSWDGHQADIVLHSEDTVNHRYVSKQYHLAISHDEGVFTETISLTDEGYWWPQPAGLYVFVPDYYENKALMKIPVVEESGNGIPIPFSVGSVPDSPIHCFRTMSDDLTVVRYASNLVARSDQEIIVYDPGCVDEPNLDRTDRTYSGLYGTTTLQIGNVTYSGSTHTVDQRLNMTSYPSGDPYFQGYDFSSVGNFSHLNTEMCGDISLREYLINTGYFYNPPSGGFGSGSSGVTTIDGIDYPNVYGLAHYDITRVREQDISESELVMTTEVFVQLPFYDCTSVFWAYRDIHISENNRVITSPKGVYAGTSIWDYRYDGSTYQPYEEVVPLYVAKAVSQSGPSDTTVYGPDTNTKVGQVNLFRYSGGDSSEPIYTEVDSAPLGSYFDISYFQDPYVYQFDWVRGDTSGGYKFFYRATASSDAEYPGDCSVGWA